MKTRDKVILFTVFVFFAASANSQTLIENINQLGERINISKIYVGINKGDRNVLSVLPAKGYKDGLAGLMEKYDVYPNPDYSFAECMDDSVIDPQAGKKPGCRISIKFARKTHDGKYEKNGIRVEYAIAPGSQQFIANHSSYAEHAIAGDGVLEDIHCGYRLK